MQRCTLWAGQLQRVSAVFGSCFSDQAAGAGALRGDPTTLCPFLARAATLLIKDCWIRDSRSTTPRRLLALMWIYRRDSCAYEEPAADLNQHELRNFISCVYLAVLGVVVIMLMPKCLVPCYACFQTLAAKNNALASRRPAPHTNYINYIIMESRLCLLYASMNTTLHSACPSTFDLIYTSLHSCDRSRRDHQAQVCDRTHNDIISCPSTQSRKSLCTASINIAMAAQQGPTTSQDDS